MTECENVVPEAATIADENAIPEAATIADENAIPEAAPTADENGSREPTAPVVTIRREQPEDFFAVENLVREAFWNVYRPGCVEHYTLHVLRDHPDFLAPLSLVLEVDGKLVGQVVYVASAIDVDDGRTVPCATLGPICVAPELARRGLGKQLLDRSLELAAEQGVGAVFLEGDIAFYGKSGFVPASQYGIRYQGVSEEDAGFFLCRVLQPGYLDGITGEYAVPDVYFVQDEDVEAFDLAFPGKEKLRLPGQLFG